MSVAKDMLVTLTVGELAELVREQIRLELQSHTATPPPALDTQQAAAYLGMSEDVLRKRVRNGEIPYFRIGVLLRFRIAELDAAFPSAKRKGS